MVMRCSYCNSNAVMPRSGLCLACGNVTEFDNQNSMQTGKQLSEEDSKTVSGQAAFEEQQETSAVETSLNEAAAVVDNSQTAVLLSGNFGNAAASVGDPQQTLNIEMSLKESASVADDTQAEAQLLENAADISDFIEEQQEASVVEASINKAVAVVDDGQAAVLLPENVCNTLDSFEDQQQTLDIEIPAKESVFVVGSAQAEALPKLIWGASWIQTASVIGSTQAKASRLDNITNTSDPLEDQQQTLDIVTSVNEPVSVVDSSQLDNSTERQETSLIIENTVNESEEKLNIDEVVDVTNFKAVETADKSAGDTDSGLFDLHTPQNALLLHKGKLDYPSPKGNSAKLDINQKKIIESCEGVFDQLKGKLGAKGNRYKSLMVTSANAQDGVTVSAIAIAVALSRYGHSNVLLIDANSDNRGVSRLFSLTETAGFFEYMSGKEVIKRANTYETIADAFSAMVESTGEKLQHLSWTQSVFYSEYKNLFVMPFAKEKSGTLWDLIDNVGVDLRLSALSQYFDFVIIDSPAVMKSSEAQILSGYLDGVIFVIKAEKTKWEVAKIALNNIEDSGGRVIGSILNRRKFYIPKFLYRWM